MLQLTFHAMSLCLGQEGNWVMLIVAAKCTKLGLGLKAGLEIQSRSVHTRLQST
jgi:hypothetical protein